MTVHSSARPFSRSVVAAAAGAVVGAGLVVAVYEGEVAVKNERGEVRLRPGDTASASPGSAPVHGARVGGEEAARLRAENEALEGALVSARQALAGDPRRLAEENAALQARLAKAEKELELLDAVRADKEGVEVEPPPDLPARFSEQALVKAFNEALAQAGVKGDVTHVDCGEYPCIVYGDVAVTADIDMMTLGEKLKGSPGLAAYAEDGEHASWWRTRSKDKESGKDVDEARFGIALYPKSDEEARGPDIEKRIGHRNREMFEAMRPPR